jgi:imidazolonepropionase-like amidohydrolase
LQERNRFVLLKPISIRAGAFTVATALSFSIASPVLTVSARAAVPDTYDGNAFAAAPNTFAITNARIVPVSGPVIERGTLVLRNGLIAAVGASVATPKDAQVIDGTGLTVYPALVDAYTHDGMPLAAEYAAPARGAFYPVTTVRAEVEAPSMLKPDANVWGAKRKNGFGSALVAPGVGLIAGTSAFVSLAPETPDTAALLIKPNVAMHASWDNPKPTGADDYPNSLMGEISAIRQALYDAVNADLTLSDYAKNPSGKDRPVISSQISALVPVVKKQKPLVLHADSAVAIRRALKIAKEFGLAPVIEGGAEAGMVASELKAAGASVLLSTALPESPKLLDGEDDPTTLQGYRYRASVPRTAGKLAAAGVPFAFATDGLKSPDEYRANVRKIIAAGLPADAATMAATQGAAKIFGAEKQLGSLTPGAIGNVLVVDGDLWGPKTKIRYLFVDGKKTDAGEPATKAGASATPRVDPAKPAPPKMTLEEAKKMLPAGVSVEQALKYLRETPKQAEQFLPKGVTVDDAIAALEGSSEADSKPEPDATKTPAKKDTDEVTAPPVVGTGLVPPLPPQIAPSFVLRGATVWTVAKDGVIPNADVYVKDGKIAAIGTGLSVPGGTLEIDAKGKHVTPGMIDAHSHTALDAVNEGSNIVTSECRIEDVIDPEDVNIYRQLAGGTTAANLLHGSANAIGGQNQIVKLRWGQSADGMMFAGAPKGIKFALGENPTQSNYQPTTLRYPYSRMGVERVIREAFTNARDYQSEWKAYKDGKRSLPPQRDLRMDALVEILEGKRAVHCHSYRQDEILSMIRIADDFGFKIGTFQHVMEGYKVADEMAKHGAGGSTFSDWWAFKFEVRDAIQYNGALMNERGVLTSFNSDSSELARRLNLEAAKAVHWGNVPPQEAIKFVTINPAKQLGIDKYVGSLEKGKDADIAVWSGDPLSTMTICEKTFVDGKLLFDRAADLAARPALEAEKKRLAEAAKPKKPTPSPSPTPAATPKPPVESVAVSNATEPQAAATAPVTAIVGATIHPVSGPDIPNGVVVMQGGKIVAVGTKDAITIPAGATVTDATGMHVYPGMFDADTQLGLREVDSMRETLDAREMATFSPELRAAVAVNPDTDLLPEARANGILTVVTAPEGGVISGQGAVLSLNGWTWEDLAIDPSVGMYMQFPRMGQRRFRETAHRCEETAGGHPEENDAYLRSGAYVAGGTADTRAMRFGLLPSVLGADETDAKEEERVEKALKPINDFLESAKRYKMAKDAGTLKQTETKWEAILPVLAGEKPFYVRADREKDIRAAVNWAKKNNFRMVLVSGQESDKCADLLAREKVPVILGTVQNLPRTQDAPYDDAFTIPAKLAKAGVLFCLTSGETASIRRLPWNAAMAASYGLDPETALKSITLNPAQITGHGAHLGSIENGKDATLIITTGSPLEITSVVKAAFIKGEPINLTTRQKQLYERYQSRPKK